MIKQILLTVLLTAFGTAMWTLGMWFARYPAEKVFVLNLALWFAGSAMIGAGVLSLFRRAGLGAILGVAVQAVTILVLGFFKS